MSDKRSNIFLHYRRLLKIGCLALPGWIFSTSLYAQQALPGMNKNETYLHAEKWLDNHHFIYDSLAAYGVPPAEGVAIVFPELMRYSALEDKIEVTGLMVLYTRLGEDYADFSVGHFQMKPTFVQQLETDGKKYLTRGDIHRICPFLLGGEDTEQARRERAGSLTDIRKEVSYLALFYKICSKRFENLNFKDPAEKIRFFATAYNCGYHHSVKNLYMQMKRKQFPVYNGLLISHVNYAALSLHWWNENRREHIDDKPATVI